MLDWAKVVGFDWDAGDERKSVDKHGVGKAEAEQVFFNEPLIVGQDSRRGEAEVRFHALGRTSQNRALHVTFTLRASGTLIRVISARTMTAKERIVYEQSA